MTKYNMDGISDAYFGSSKQYNDYTKYLADQEEEKRARQAAIIENNKRMSTVSDSHYPNNEKNARMRDVSPAYNFGGSQYKKILGISDPAFSGGDEYVAYAEYLNERAQRNKSAADGKPVIETKVRNNLAGGNGIIEKPWWAGYVSSTLPWPGAEVETNPYIEQGLVSENMPMLTVYTQQINTDMEPKTLRAAQPSYTSENNTQNMQRLEDEVTEIVDSYQDIPADDYMPWNTVLAVDWQADKRLFSKTDDILIMFKAQWLHGNRNLIRAAAQKYDIPVELLAGVAWSEVGGDPPWVDPAAYYVRSKVTPYIPEQYWGKAPDMLVNNPIFKYLGVGKAWSDATKDPQKTSFGDLSMQIRVAAETLGISPEQLDVTMEKELINALQKPEFSIFIAAKHLADLKRVDFADVPSDKLTMDQIATIASRYNIGAGASYEKAAGNSYGKAVKKHLPFIMEYCFRD